VSLRTRLFVALAAISAAPILVLTLAFGTRARQRVEDAERERLTQSLEAVRNRIDARRSQAARTLERVAAQELPMLDPALIPAGESIAPRLARSLATGTDLDVLEIVGGDGRVLSSLHWPTGFGLNDADIVLSADASLRLETAAAGRGAIEKLSVTSQTRVALHGRPLTLRGGYFLDAEFFADFHVLLGVEVGCWDPVRARWYTREASPLEAWIPEPFSVSSGTASDPRANPPEPWTWVRSSLTPQIELVATAPRSARVSQLDGLIGVTRNIAAAAVGTALLFAWFLSAWVSRPLQELARGVERIAAGDWRLPLSTPRADEFGDLARAFDDMTASLRLSQVRLQRSERVAAWREMARRLAHELKNPLFPIQISIETTIRALERETDRIPVDLLELVRASSTTTLQELAALRKIIDEFGAFARMPPPAPRSVDLAALLERVLALRRNSAPRVEMQLDLAPGLPLMRADADQIARAIGNLVANAIDAMPDGGTLTLRARADTREVVIDVQDTGSGIPANARERLFTPYYTSKRSGTGLGLSIVQAIVSDHGGHIDIHASADTGTTFRLVLPLEGPPEQRR
jgi:signal transduction histidine kinase